MATPVSINALRITKQMVQMEEAQGETFLWHELKENFIKDFNFIPQDENLVETEK